MKHTISILVSLFVLLAGTNAFATDPYICDPDEDPDCTCPGDGTYDVCYETPVKNLVDPSDPVALRKAAKITATWDSANKVYDVSIDVTALSAAGVIKMHKNRGKWDSVDEFNQYMMKLFGIRSWADMCKRMPPLNVEQTGITYRYNQFDDEWAKYSSGSLLWDVITDENGAITLAGEEFQLFGQDCAGSDPKAFATGRDDALYAEQCSDIFDETRTIVGGGNGDICQVNDLVYRISVAKTKIETSSFVEFDRTLRCAGGSNGTALTCDETSKIIHGRVEADTMSLRDIFFKVGGGTITPNTLSESPGVEAEQSLGDAKGVCGNGKASENNNSMNVSINTRDGYYDTSKTLCAF